MSMGTSMSMGRMGCGALQCLYFYISVLPALLAFRSEVHPGMSWRVGVSPIADPVKILTLGGGCVILTPL